MEKSSKKSRAIAILNQAYKSKDTGTTGKFENLMLPSEEKLSKELQKVLDMIGNTPLDEPALYEASLDSISDVEDILLEDAKYELDEDKLSAVEIRVLANQVSEKISKFIDEDGIYKTTPNIDKVKIPKRKALNKIQEFANLNKEAAEKLLKDLQENDEMPEDEKAKQFSEQTKQFSEELNDKIFEAFKVKKEDISEWEQNLIAEMLTSYVVMIRETTVSNASDVTPFARYIKN